MVGIAGTATAEPVLVRADSARKLQRTVPVIAVPVGGTSEALDGRSLREIEPVHGSVRLPGTIQLDLAPGLAWRITVVDPTLFSSEEILFVAPGQGTVRADIRVWPTGSVRGTFDQPVPFEALETEPPTLEVSFESPPGEDATPRVPPSTVPCTLVRSDWQCTLPATRLDLRFRLPGFASVFLWDVEVVAEGVVESSPLRLIPGSSIVGRFTTRSGQLPERRPEVEIRPGLAQSEPVARGLAFVGRDWFQFSAVEPGVYTLALRHPTLAASEVAGIQVHADRETELRQPVVLDDPLSLDIRIIPPFDPRGLPWTMALHRSSVLGHRESEVTPVRPLYNAHWSGAGLAPGLYRLRVFAGDGSQWFNETFAVDANREVVVNLDWIEIDGDLRLAGEPLAAELWFGGRSGPRRFHFESDVEGRFAGYLPTAGSWRVDVRNDHVRRALSEVIVPEPLPGEKAALRIDLPSAGVRGQVIDPEGRAVSVALVYAFPLAAGEAPVAVRTDRQGRFRLDGLASDALRLRATTADRMETTDWTRIEVAEGTVREVELVVWPKRRVRGRVTTAQGNGLTGASLSAWPASSPFSFAQTAVSGVDGGFELDLPPGTRRVALRVQVPGMALSTQVVDLTGDGLEIRLPRATGTLSIRTPDPCRPKDRRDPYIALFQGEAFVGAIDLCRWSRIHGAEPGPDFLLVPALAAEPYVVCRLTDLDVEAAVEERYPDGQCDRGEVPPFSELVLTPPG